MIATHNWRNSCIRDEHRRGVRLTAMTTVLDQEMYTEAEAARLLRVAPATLHYWLEGGTRRNKTFKPVIREEATGSRTVTWAEFVEAGLLRQYRRQHNVPMATLRSISSSLIALLSADRSTARTSITVRHDRCWPQHVPMAQQRHSFGCRATSLPWAQH
jgi:hypothetical protein